MKQQAMAMVADQGLGFEHYPKAGSGRPPIGLQRMLRIHFIQHWFNLADLTCERALYDSASVRRFVGVDMGREPVPDATPLLKFRRLLNAHKLGEALFAKVGQELQVRGFKVNTGTIVDATIIGALSSTRNADKMRDPAMHQTKKGLQRYFGMKLHIGVDSQLGMAHSSVVTAANAHDKHPLPDLLHGNETRVCGDSAYSSQNAPLEDKAYKARDFTNQRTRRGGIVDEGVRAKNRHKSRIRSRVEHVFGVVKRLWGFGRVSYRSVAKNATRAFTALALANIYLGRQRFMAQVIPKGGKRAERLEIRPVSTSEVPVLGTFESNQCVMNPNSGLDGACLAKPQALLSLTGLNRLVVQPL